MPYRLSSCHINYHHVISTIIMYVRQAAQFEAQSSRHLTRRLRVHSITSRDNSQTTKQPVRAKTKQCGKSAEINAKSLVHERHGDSPPSHQQRLAAPACHVTADHSPVLRMDQQEYQRSLLQTCVTNDYTQPPCNHVKTQRECGTLVRGIVSRRRRRRRRLAVSAQGVTFLQCRKE